MCSSLNIATVSGSPIYRNVLGKHESNTKFWLEDFKRRERQDERPTGPIT
jgi:hypothetical protein